MQNNHHLKNPQLPGDPFFFDGNDVGIMLLHGFTATTAEVRPLAHFLHKQGYTVAGALLPGHGTKPADLNRVSWQDWVTEGEQLYLKLKDRCKTVLIGGESTGGLICLWLAQKYPEINGLLAYAPALKLPTSRMDIIKLYAISPFIPFIQKALSDDDLAWQGYKVNPLKGAIQLLKLQNEVRKDLNTILQPTLIVQGRLDQTIDPEGAKTIYQEISSKRKEIHWMENSTHCVILDRELDQVEKITLEFIHSILND